MVNTRSKKCNTYTISSGAIPKTGYYTEYDLPHHIYTINCTGTEASILECPYSVQIGSGSNCYSHEDAAVICQSMIVYRI